MAHQRARWLTVLACALAALSTSAGPASAPAVHGKLLIIGGGMTKAMAPVIYGVLADQLPPHGTVGYLPTAGETMTDAAVGDGRLAQNLKGRTVHVINITTAAQADDADLAKQIEGCDAVFFGGGSQSRITSAFHPLGRATKISAAVDALLARGGVVAGTSAGAACMSDPMIAGGESTKALADATALPIAPGMGYFPFGLTDQHFLQRGRFGRLVVALERTHQRFGFGISEARALLVDRPAATLTAIGHDAVVFINRADATGRSNVRINLLGDGDAIDGNTGAVTVSPSRPPHDLGERAGSDADVPEAFAKLALDKLFHDLIAGHHATASALDAHATLRFTIDDRTRLYAAAADPQDVTILNLRLDVLPPPPTTKP